MADIQKKIDSERYIRNDTFAEPKDSIIPHILLWVVQIVALSSPPFRGRRELFVTTIICLAIWNQTHPHFTNDPGRAQPFAIAWSFYMNTLQMLLFSTALGPEARHWRIDQPAREALAYTGFGFRKLRWAVSLMLNQRGVRWNFSVKNVHKVLAKSRARSLAFKAFEFVKYVIAADIVFQLGIRLFFTSPDGEIGAVNSKFVTLKHPDWRWRFVKCFVFGATPYFMVSMQYAQFAFISILLGLTKDEDWPPLFGRLSDATTIRDFWGKFWHQQLRNMLTSYTTALIRLLKIKRGTNASSYTQLWAAFALSGSFHALSQLFFPSPVNIPFSMKVPGVFYFFLFQAAAITFEDFIQWIWRQILKTTIKGKGDGHVQHEENRPRLWRKVIGWIWITTVIWTSLPLAADAYLAIRMGDKNMLPFTLVGPWMQYVPLG